MSTAVAADPAHLTIALADNALLNLTTSCGQPVDANSLLAVPALFGDADLSGTVDLNDLNIVLNNLGATSSAWTSGNFDGAPTIDLNDLNDVLNNLGLGYANNTSFLRAEALIASATPTPEPKSFILLALGISGILRRPRRCRSLHLR